MDRSLLRLSNGFNIQQMMGVKTPYAVIDEADQLSEINQHHLRAFMDNSIGCVILTTNHIHALDKGIRDRADEVQIKSLSPSAVFERANDILKLSRLSDCMASKVILLASQAANISVI